MTPNPFRHAIDLTTRSIDRRSFHFRNVIVAVVAIGILSIFSALLIRSWRPLTALSLLPSVIGFFIVADTLIVGSWRNAVTTFWAQGDVEFSVFIQTITMMKALPKVTTDGMLRLLPQQCASIPKERPAFRSAIAATDHAVTKVQTIQTIRTIVAWFVIPVSVGLALCILSVIPLLVILLLFPLFLVTFLMEQSIWKEWLRKVKDGIGDNSFGRDEFIHAASGVAWDFRNPKVKELNLLSINNL